MGSLPTHATYEVVIAGAGFSGLYLLHRLRNLGFSVRIFSARSNVGGTWYWNCYPGARVDTEVPAYQFSADETWDTWNWSERYPSRNELWKYFKHVDKWDDRTHEWNIEVNNGATVCRSRFMILCTGFATKTFVPPFKGLDNFEGVISHTAEWPQEGIKLKGTRVAVFGTGASGVQVIQQIAPVVSHMTVIQRTPNLALPMGQRKFSEDQKAQYPESHNQMMKTYADVSEAERNQFYEDLWNIGGLKFWLGNYKDVLFHREANKSAYEFWRENVRRRLHKPEVIELLTPTVPPHPFGAKRVGLERGYYEAFNQSNVDIISLIDNPVDEITANGFDVIILATGFQSMSAGISHIEIRGVGGTLINEKWSENVRTYLGMTAPTAFATGTSAAELQGEWITDTIRYVRREQLFEIEPTSEAEEEWRNHCNEMGKLGLFEEAESWYSKPVKGGKKEALNYMAGLPVYRKKCWLSSHEGYKGFTLR